MAIKLTETQQQNLKSIVDHFDLEDLPVRQRQLRVWRRLKLFWENFQNVWFDSVAHDWRIWDEVSNSQGDSNQSYYDKKVNVFRAYLESIIAALSVTVPLIKCYPDDADNTLDLSTARAGDKIAELIYRHNDVSLLWLHGLFVFCTEGMVAAYNYTKEDEKYGNYIEEKWEDVNGENEITECPACQYQMEVKELTPEESQVPMVNPLQPPLPGMQAPEEQMNMEGLNNPHEEEMESQLRDEFMPGEGYDICPSCNSSIIPNMRRESFTITRLVGETSKPKARVHLECYGGLNIKIPNYARRQSECLYLMYNYETHYANAIEKFEHLKKTDLVKNLQGNPAGPYDMYEQWARLSPQYQGEYPINNVTIRQIWLRPASFNVLHDEHEVKGLKKLFPNGVKVCMVNDKFAEACKENLDDHWTLTYNPLSDFVHFDPLGLLLASIQEITNDLNSLVLQTIEHGIGQTFADPNVLDFDAYQQSEVLPGGIFPAKPKAGKSIGDAFHDVKTAQLSGEVLPFAQNIQEMGQLVSGALPSLFGQMDSETASQDSMSKAQALQRLQNTWKMFGVWWKTIFGKAIPMYIKCMKVDEKDVKMKEDGSFINSFIKLAEMEGKLGKVELEANENLPLTWNQKKDIVMQLLLSPNPDLLKIILAPENLDIIRDAIGLNDIYVPGEDDREAEYDEIKSLLESEPIVMPPDPMMMEQAAMMGQELPPQEMPSIEIDKEIDNHPIRFDICRGWLVSLAGRQAKVENPQGYKNVLLHAKLHLTELQMAMQAQTMAPEGEGAPSSKKPSGNSNKEAPITGVANVQTIQ